MGAFQACNVTKDCAANHRCFEYEIYHINSTTTYQNVCGSCTTQLRHFNGSLTVLRPLDDGAPNCPLPEEGACIAADALRHVPVEQLVYRPHRRAAVLCDEEGNCATPGHMVVYKGEAMMMKSYCEVSQQRCVKTVTFVNSPKITARVPLDSYSPHLRYTPFASRYEHRLEERLLSVIIRLGF